MQRKYRPSTLPTRLVPTTTVAVAWLLSAASVGKADDAKILAYGRHLAQECTSCHRIDGIDNGIPSIIGWTPDTFAATVKFYRDGARTNPVMMSVAGSLSDQQIEALAAFFGSLQKPPAKAGSPAGGKAGK